MTNKKLRPYQELAIQRMSDAIKVGKNRGLINFATGLGKTFTIIKATEQLFHPRSDRTLFMAPARSLVWQMEQNFKTDFPESQLDYPLHQTYYPGLGVIMGKVNQVNARIMVSSVQSLLDRVEMEEDRNDIPIERRDLQVDRWGNVSLSPNSRRRVLISKRFDSILANGGAPETYVYDEAHHAVAAETLRMYKRLQELHSLIDKPPPNIIGLTATPMRWDGIALGNLFDTIYIQRDFRWAQRNGYLAPFAEPLQVGIEFQDQDDLNINIASNWKSLIVDTWQEVASDRQVIGFTSPIGSLTGVEVAKDLAEEFRTAGIPAAQIDGMGCIDEDGNPRPIEYRGEIFRKYMKREIRVLFMYGVGLEGLDLPVADCLFWLRRTDNVLLMTQAVGRILRLHPGKEDALIVDFTGKGISVSPMGTLLGLMIDPDEVEEEMEEPEDLLEESLDGQSLLDMSKDDQMVQADGTIITVGRIINKQSHDWYHDAVTDSMSLAINSANMLVIKYPNYSLQQTSQEYLRILTSDEIIDFSSDSVYGTVQRNTVTFDEESFNKWLELLRWLEDYAGKFTLWHVAPSFEESRLIGNGYIAGDGSLDTLMATASRYSHNQVENHQDFLMGRSHTWSGKATQKQRGLLKQLGHEEWDAPDLKKKEASKMVSHTLAYRAITQYESQINKLMKQLEE